MFYLHSLEKPKLRNSFQCVWVGSTRGLTEVNTDPFWNDATCNPLTASSKKAEHENIYKEMSHRE